MITNYEVVVLYQLFLFLVISIIYVIVLSVAQTSRAIVKSLMQEGITIRTKDIVTFWALKP